MKVFSCTRRRARFALRGFGISLIGSAGWLVTPVTALYAGKPAAVPVYTLQDCLALVSKQNPDVVAEGKRVEAARAAIFTARAGIYPSVTSTGYYQYREQSLSSQGGVDGNTRKVDYYGDGRVSQNLYSAGAVRNRIAAAKITLEAENNTYLGQVDTSTLAARMAFYQVLFAEASIGVRQEAVDLLDAQLKDQTDHFAAGSVGQLNVNRAQVALANEVPALLDAKASVTTSYVALAQLLGVRYPDDALAQPFRIRGNLSCPPVRLSLAECIARAESARPEIAQRKLAIDALKHQAVVEKSATRPQVSAFASYDIYSEPSLLSVRENFSGYTVGVQATWNIFDGFATRGRVRGVEAQEGAAEAQLQATRQQVEADVRTAYYDLRQAIETLQPLAANIAKASETQGLSVQNFDAGLTTQLDVLQARVDVTRARVLELGVRLRYQNALARLERAMGMGRPTQGSAATLPGAKK